MAYPPDWDVDESEAVSDNQVTFTSPDETEIAIVGTQARRDPNANVDVLRDQFFQGQSGFCDRTGIDATATEQISGLTFATLGATCATDGVLLYIYTGIGLNDQVPWFYAFLALNDQYPRNAQRFFQPMIQTLNIYAAPSSR
jgi:hypothetical protein